MYREPNYFNKFCHSLLVFRYNSVIKFTDVIINVVKQLITGGIFEPLQLLTNGMEALYYGDYITKVDGFLKNLN